MQTSESLIVSPIEAISTFASASVVGGTGLSAVVIVMLISATLMIYTATSRKLWAFARVKGVPGSDRLAIVHPRYKLPSFWLAVVFLVTLLLSLINIGSAISFNATLSLPVAGYMVSYFIPQALILYRRVQAVRGKIFPGGRGISEFTLALL